MRRDTLPSAWLAPAMSLAFVVLQPGAVGATAPPQLPQSYVDTTYTPPAGLVHTVNAGGNLQAALDAALPGDIIRLQAGATFTGPFTLPLKSGNDWIVVRTSAPDASLPPAGTRIGPAHAALLPKIVTPNSGPALQTEAGAHHFRFIGVEFTVAPAVTMTYGLVSLGDGSNAQNALADVPHHLILDRCYVHGNATANVRRGVGLNSAWSAVIDSYISDIHEVGADSQAIAGWNGPGPFKIANNRLEGAGENVLFGGADPSIQNLVPSDIEVRGNYFFKPLSWKIGHPTYAGRAWSVKNIFELKNARRVLATGNVFENNWSHAQNGFAILFTVRNQDGTAPWSTVEDVTFRLNIVRHTGSAVNILGTDNLAPSQRTKRMLVKDNVFEDVSKANWGGSGRLFQVLDGPADVDVDHNTAMHTGEVIMAAGPASSAFAYRNNMTAHNQYGVAGDGTFGDPMGTLAVYFPGAIFTKNVLMGGDAADYPAGNFFPINWAAVLFTNLPGGNYLLAALSPYRNAGSDGKDVGADIGALQVATANTISGGGGGGGGGDTTPPVITGVGASSVTATGAVVGWTTNEPSDSQADYGLTTAYGSTTALDPALVTAHARTLSGLQPNTLYHFRVRSKDAAGNLAVSGDVTFRTLTAPDTTPPVITGVGASSVTNTGAIVGWTTNEPSDSQADYGLTTAYGSTTALDPARVTSHARTLSGLQPNTLYHFRVRSKDAAGNLAVSGDVTFRTLTAPDTTPPVITGVGASSVTTTGAVVGWTTNEASDSQADYGLTTAYGSTTALDPTRVTAHTRALSGLQPNTLYHFRVRSKDAAGNLAVSGDVTFRTLAASDGARPTVSFSAPTAGASVSASITVSAIAADNVGVVGVRFLLDGVPLGPDDLTAPYSITWSTVTATNGAHVLNAVAWDAAGNTASAGRGVTVANGGGGGTTAVTWTSLVKATTTGSVLQKTTGCDGCQDAGAVSTEALASGNGYLEVTASETTTQRLVGLSLGNSDTSGADIDFAFQFWPGGTADVRENGLYRNAETRYVPGDKYRIAVVSGAVQYYKNGVLLYTSTRVPTYPLLADTSLMSAGATIGPATLVSVP